MTVWTLPEPPLPPSFLDGREGGGVYIEGGGPCVFMHSMRIHKKSGAGSQSTGLTLDAVVVSAVPFIVAGAIHGRSGVRRRVRGGATAVVSI
jgi:hypothetical protein